MKLNNKTLEKCLTWANKTIPHARKEFDSNQACSTYWHRIPNTDYSFMLTWEDGFDEPNPVQLVLSLRVNDTDMFPDAWDFADKEYCDTVTISGNYCGEGDLKYLIGNAPNTGEDLVEEVKFSYSRSTNQTSHMMSNYHTKFNCKIEFRNKEFSTAYQCNVDTYGNPKKEEVLGWMFNDSEIYDCCRGIEDFCDELWYDYHEDKKECERIFNGCKKESETLHDMFGNDEIEKIKEYLEDMGVC